MKKFRQLKNRRVDRNMSKNNTKTKINSLGEVELKWISLGDVKKYAKFLEQKYSDKDFTLKILFHQLIKPKIKFNTFKKLSDKEIVKLGKAFIKKEDYFFKYYQDTSDFFQDFRKAIKTQNKKFIEKLGNTFGPIIKSTQDILTSFRKSYASVVLPTLDSSSYISKIIDQLTFVGKQVQESQLKTTVTLKPIIEQFSTTARILTESIKPQIDFWQKWADQNKSVFDSISINWSEFQNRYHIAESKAVLVLQKYKWFISPNMPIDFIFKVVQLGQRKGRQDSAINKLFVDYFSQNNWQYLEAISKNWKKNPLFKKRIKIINDCIEILKTADIKTNVANVVLPTLIAQIDGFLTDYLDSKNISVRTYTEKKSQFKENSTKPINPELNELANRTFLNILFQRSQKGEPLKTPFNFNRHKIMHGESTNYGRNGYLIRSFLIIDFLVSLK
jgi:hypothetical protein